MIFGLTFEKLIVIGVIAALILGPERVPRYAEMLAQGVKRARVLLGEAKDRMRDELGEDVDWRTLDPRQYDPRRIIREALLDDTPSASTPEPVVTPDVVMTEAFVPGGRPPFDSEAT